MIASHGNLTGERARLVGGERVPGEDAPSRFSKALGLDLIVTPDDRTVLIELQSGFGRRGLLEQFPEQAGLYRKTYWDLRRRYGIDPTLIDGVCRIASNKILTYELLSSYQPPSLAAHRWTAAVRRWLEGLRSDFVLSKPPRGSCGKGIRVFDRKELLRTRRLETQGRWKLLQEFVESRHFPDEKGRAHLGCIRHIVMLRSDGNSLSFLHAPSYWRVSPTPFEHRPDAEALTANISRGAYPRPVSEKDAVGIREMSERVSRRLVEHVLGPPFLLPGSSTLT